MDFRVYLIACVKNTNSSVVFGFPSVTLNTGVITAFLHSSGMQFSLYVLFKNCSNLSLNSSGAYLYSSELMLTCPGFSHFLLILTPFPVHLNL